MPNATAASPIAPLRGGRPRWLGGLALAIAALVLVPIVAVLASIFARGSGTWAHLVATVLPDYLATTARLAIGVAIGAIVIGVSCAWLVSTYRFPGRRIYEWALILPMAMPAYVVAYAYVDWLQFAGPVQTALRTLGGWKAGDYWFPDVRSEGGAIVVFSLALYPYVYLLARSAFLEQSASMLEAGRLMGFGPWRSFARIALPLARPAIAAGTALVLMETLADFGAVSYFGIHTFTTGIYRAWQSFGDQVAAAQLAATLLVVVAVILVAERATRGRARFQTNAVARRARADPASGRAGIAMSVVCAIPIVLGFLLPAGLLARLMLAEPAMAIGARLAGLVANSFILGAVGALIVTGAALLLGYAARGAASGVIRAANQVAGLGYAIPGAVIAVGILLPLGRIDNWIVSLARELTGERIGLVLTGSVIALLYAYLVRFLAIALQTVEAGLARITPNMDDAARSLGVRPWETLLRVHAPMLRASVFTAVLLVFVDVMKELPASFALRPFNFDTLAIEIYNLAKDERLGEAALPSLLIVAVGLLPVALLSRQIASRRED